MSERKIGQYLIEETLGRGGMGTVYAARHESFREDRCAIKVLHDEIAKDAGSRNRFQDEAVVMRKLGKENRYILAVEDFRKDDGGASWMRMPLIEGIEGTDGKRWVTLRDRMMAEKTMTEHVVIEILEQILEGLGFAHAQGVIHRDLKPENILLTPEGIRIADFGLAGVMSAGLWESKLIRSVGESTLGKPGGVDLGLEKTFGGAGSGSETAALLGTYSYMAPEVKPANSGGHSVASDLYAVGLMAYQMLTGQSDLGREKLTDFREDLGAGWDGWLDKAVATRSEKRYASAKAMADAMREVAGKSENGVTAHEEALPAVPVGHQTIQLERMPAPVTCIPEMLTDHDEESQASQETEYLPPLPYLGVGSRNEEPKRNEADLGPNRPNRRRSPKRERLILLFGSVVVLFGVFAIVKWGGWLRKSTAEINAIEKGKISVLPSGQENQHVKISGESEKSGTKPEAMEGSRAGEVRILGGIEMVWCPPTGPEGFTMGTPEGEEDRGDDEMQHRVVLTKGFWMAKTETTQGQWEVMMGTDVNQQKAKSDSYGVVIGEGANQPMYFVSWEDAQDYMTKMNSQNRLPSGWNWVLPTEAQWEYACRAGTTTMYAGDLGEMAWYDENSGDKTNPVGTKRANEWGLHDMHGNVSEWCVDWYGDYPTGSAIDPRGDDNGSRRVYRGGNWFFTAADCRSVGRSGFTPGIRYDFLGFRPAAVPASR